MPARRCDPAREKQSARRAVEQSASGSRRRENSCFHVLGIEQNVHSVDGRRRPPDRRCLHCEAGFIDHDHKSAHPAGTARENAFKFAQARPRAWALGMNENNQRRRVSTSRHFTSTWPIRGRNPVRPGSGLVTDQSHRSPRDSSQPKPEDQDMLRPDQRFHLPRQRPRVKMLTLPAPLTVSSQASAKCALLPPVGVAVVRRSIGEAIPPSANSVV